MSSIAGEFLARLVGESAAYYVARKPGEIKVEQVPELTVVAIAGQAQPNDLDQQVDVLQRRLLEFLELQGVTPAGNPLAIYSAPPDKGPVDFSACLPVAEPQEDQFGSEIISRVLPGGEMATMVYRGPYAKRYREYKGLAILMKGRGSASELVIREEHLVGPLATNKPKKFLTKVFWPTGE